MQIGGVAVRDGGGRTGSGTLIELILSICLMADPGVCRTERLSYGDGLDSAQACVFQAPPRIAQWASRHPQWRIVRWRCGVHGDDEEV